MKTRSKLRRHKAQRAAPGPAAPLSKDTVLLAAAMLALVLIEGVRPEWSSSGRALFYSWSEWIGRGLYVSLLCAGLIAYLWVRKPALFKFDRQKWFLLGLIFLNAAAIQGFGSLSPYLMPIALSVGLGVMFFGPEVGLVTSLLLAGLASLSVPAPAALALLAGGMVMVLRARRLERQRELVLVGLEVGLVNISALLALALLSGGASWQWQAFATAGLNGPINALLLSGMVPLAEYLLQRSSRFSLVELLNTSHPLLERLARAPGTYQHSLGVSRLASEAARAIGADALLAQVGGLYHDIGKAAEGVQPVYFAENQRDGYNPHDHLPPNISRIILSNHVKAGLEMGQSSGLKQDVLQFIAEHHGTSVMRFFYLKALKDPQQNVGLSLDHYRYDGPRPQSRETAILMICDAAESASRSVEDPEQMKALLDRIVKENLEDGQFDDSPLTLSDLTRIKQSVILALRSMMHTRPGQYPEARLLKGQPTSKAASTQPG